MGLTVDELPFYDALTRPEAVKDFFYLEVSQKKTGFDLNRRGVCPYGSERGIGRQDSGACRRQGERLLDGELHDAASHTSEGGHKG